MILAHSWPCVLQMTHVVDPPSISMAHRLTQKQLQETTHSTSFGVLALGIPQSDSSLYIPALHKIKSSLTGQWLSWCLEALVTMIQLQ